VDKWNDDERSSNPKNLEKCRELPTRFAGSDGKYSYYHEAENYKLELLRRSDGNRMYSNGRSLIYYKLKYEGFVRH
jgi:hypothetical protein